MENAKPDENDEEHRREDVLQEQPVRNPQNKQQDDQLEAQQKEIKGNG